MRKKKLRWWCLDWLQTSAGLCISVWPITITEEIVIDRVFFPSQKIRSFGEGLSYGIGSFCWCCILKGGWGGLGTQRQSLSSQEADFFFQLLVLFSFWHGRKMLSWFLFELSTEEQSWCYTESLKLFVQVDIGLFGVKISQSPPGSQGLHCAALGRLGKVILCDAGLHMQLP